LTAPDPIDLAAKIARLEKLTSMGYQVHEPAVAVLAYLRELALGEHPPDSLWNYDAVKWRQEIIRLTGGAS